MSDGGDHDDRGDHQPALGAPAQRQPGVERRGPDEAEGAAEVAGALVLAAPVGVGELGLEGPARGGEEQLGAGHGDVAGPDQHDRRQPSVSWVTIVIAQAMTKKALLTRAPRSAVGMSRTVRATAIGSTMHIIVLVREERGQQHAGRVGLGDQPQRDHRVQQHLVGHQHAAEERGEQVAGVAQRARHGARRLGLVDGGGDRGLQRRGPLLVRGRRQPGDPVAVDQAQRRGQQRQRRQHGVALEGQRHRAQARTQGEAEVGGGVHVGLRADPLGARQHVEHVGAAGRAAGGVDHLEDHADDQERDEAVDPGPGGVRRRGARRRRSPTAAAGRPGRRACRRAPRPGRRPRRRR